jgi:UDP-GlcNAc:undecaprenyl-phosphate GlcNAc-1-phosphate transferase
MDDWRGLPPAPRFALQLLTAGLLVTAAPEFRLGVCSQWPMVSGGLAAVWIAAMTNAFNFLDNMDGLAAGIAAVSLALLAAMSLMAGHAFSAVVGLVLVGAIAGFLLYNFPPASIFMGDAGGFALGFLVGGLSAGLSHHCGPALPQALLPLLALSLPAYDFTTIILLRLCRGVPPWRGDRNHVSHRLVRRGLSRRGAVLLIYLVTLVAGLPAVVALSAPAGTGWVWLVVLLALGAMGGWLDLARGRAYPP